MKFMVEVNRKWMVQVESTSNCGAEHVILDNIDIAEDALAYDEEAMKTDMFVSAMMNCKVISYEELKKANDNFKAKVLEQNNELLEEINRKNDEIKRLEEKVAMAKFELETLIENHDEFVKEHCRIATNAMTPAETIELLRK